MRSVMQATGWPSDHAGGLQPARFSAVQNVYPQFRAAAGADLPIPGLDAIFCRRRTPAGGRIFLYFQADCSGNGYHRFAKNVR